MDTTEIVYTDNVTGHTKKVNVTYLGEVETDEGPAIKVRRGGSAPYPILVEQIETIDGKPWN